MANRWWEIQILCTPVLEELIFWRLEQFGCRGTASEKQGKVYLVRAYLPQLKAELLDVSALALWLRQDALALELPSPQVQWHLIDEEDWASSWKQHWQPQEIGDRFAIYPAWLPPPPSPERLIVRLDPGSAFGTGLHPTTQLCLEALEMRLGGGKGEPILADIGCGSGILSIGSLLLGAKRVYAVDTDPLAVKATRSNLALNNFAFDRLVVEQGSIERLVSLTQNPFDGIVCNIIAEVILKLIPQLSAIAHAHTWGILSGILLDQSQMIADCLEHNDWLVGTLWRRKEWCCFNIRRAPQDD